MMYVTYLERPTEDENYNKYDGYHHSYILHNGMYHLGRFPSWNKLNDFLNLANLSIDLREDTTRKIGGRFQYWAVDGEVKECHFMSMSDIPSDAKKFIGLSNGSLVNCYLKNDAGVLHIYRPNPNVKEIYKPLGLAEHITHCKENGYV